MDGENKTLIENAMILHPGGVSEQGAVLVDGGQIVAVGAVLPDQAEDAIRVDGGGRLLTPGLIDMHTHGVEDCRYDVDEELIKGAARLAKYGCTCVYPTLVATAEDSFRTGLQEVAAALPQVADICVPGLHLEGPFMAFTGAGCVTTPGDVKLLEDLLAAAEGRVAIMSLSPEVDNILPVIERLGELGITAFITHTGADLEQTQRALDAGARHATHFYDVFYPQPETDLGVRPVACVEAILADRRATVDFICDGVHVEPTAIRMGLLCKGWENVMLITDSNIGAGLPPGDYETPWGFSVHVHPEKAARIIGEHKFAGALAGSALTMNLGMANLHRWFGDEFTSEQLWALGTANPARLMGLQNKGRIAVGADADLVLWNDGFTPAATWVGGRLVFEAQHA
ncbi:MAG: amidohydrolase family protein [Lentisphaeria bacterium]|nr:amidohydrolase family protein [Lentisphaeria bacterium]